ncbi:glyoxalase [Sinorhizobium terangae]|uniref:Glyoxalase n=1 Tax=Sinorhizobium terangae TaxID=110322 RepID=A0A6N7LI77_SINTE|nr:VOC family protein [Sinorhizobium terangae]MQX16898.1 glyoxalase [Sinorhizobium terangae]
MLLPNLILSYVRNPAESSAFYSRLLGRQPSASFPTYVAFEFDSGLSLGLWSMSAENFHTAGSGNRTELAFMVENDAAVERIYGVWRQEGVTIEQELMTAVFGRTFVALDPDGHRLRVCTPDD